MLDKSLVFSISAMRAVLAGEPFRRIAQRCGLTPSAVRFRVLRLALYLHRYGGLPDVAPASLKYLSTLRKNRDLIEAALACAESDPAFAVGYRSREKAVLGDGDIEAILLHAGFHSQMPLRDVALVHIALATGARAGEIAKLQIQDYLNSDGSVRTHSFLNADTAFNRRPRALFFFHPGSVRAINACLEERLRKKNPPPAPDAPFRGFLPEEALFLNDDGEPFKTERKKRYQNRQILDTYRKILARADMSGLNMMALRRTHAARLLRQGAEVSKIKSLLGVANTKGLQNLTPEPPAVPELMVGLYPDKSGRPPG